MTCNSCIEPVMVAIGAAVGGFLRYVVVNNATFGIGSFVGTFIVNVTGCFLIGVIWAILSKFSAPNTIYLLLVTGLLGGYTTYSAYALDTVTVFLDGHLWRGIGYAVSTMFGGILSCALGVFISRMLFKLL